MAHYLLERYVSSSARTAGEDDEAARTVSRAVAGVGQVLLTLYLDEDEACFYLVEAQSRESLGGLEGLIDRISLVNLA